MAEKKTNEELFNEAQKPLLVPGFNKNDIVAIVNESIKAGKINVPGGSGGNANDIWLDLTSVGTIGNGNDYIELDSDYFDLFNFVKSAFAFVDGHIEVVKPIGRVTALIKTSESYDEPGDEKAKGGELTYLEKESFDLLAYCSSKFDVGEEKNEGKIELYTPNYNAARVGVGLYIEINISDNAGDERKDPNAPKQLYINDVLIQYLVDIR